MQAAAHVIRAESQADAAITSSHAVMGMQHMAELLQAVGPFTVPEQVCMQRSGGFPSGFAQQSADCSMLRT